MTLSVTGRQLDITIFAKDALKSKKTSGLFGVYNGNPDDDLTLPNGTIINPNSTREYIHYNFGEICKYTSWFI